MEPSFQVLAVELTGEVTKKNRICIALHLRSLIKSIFECFPHRLISTGQFAALVANRRNKRGQYDGANLSRPSPTECIHPYRIVGGDCHYCGPDGTDHSG